MARAARSLHSRLVAWAKVLLPLTALVSLSLLFLLARTINPEDAIPYAQVDVEERIREPRVTAPAYAGVTADGAALTIRAAEARPGAEGSENAASATAVDGLLETPDGGTAHLTANAARLDEVAGRMLFSGGVTVETSTGYTVTMPEAATALTRTEIESGGDEVTAKGPPGDLRADHMRLTEQAGGYLLVFNGSVRLIYQPPQ